MLGNLGRLSGFFNSREYLFTLSGFGGILGKYQYFLENFGGTLKNFGGFRDFVDFLEAGIFL